jgi:hypothetical protein
MIGVPGRNGLNSLGKIIGGNKYLSMMSARRRLNLTYEVHTPLLERAYDHNRPEGEGF